MLDIAHVLKGSGQSFIANLRIALFHTFNGLPHGETPRRGDFQPIIINCDLNTGMINIAAVHYRIDNQLSNGVRWDLVHVLPIYAPESCAHVNVAQHILVRLLDEFLRGARELTSVHEHGLSGSFEYTALHHRTDGFIASQNRISVRRSKSPVLFA